MVSRVVSLPPCMLEVEQKAAPTLPINEPASHSLPVESMKVFSGALMFPKRVGDPSTSASHHSRSAGVASGSFPKAACAFWSRSSCLL